MQKLRSTSPPGGCRGSRYRIGMLLTRRSRSGCETPYRLCWCRLCSSRPCWPGLRRSVVVELGGVLAKYLEVRAYLHFNLGTVREPDLHLVGGGAVVFPFHFAHGALPYQG